MKKIPKIAFLTGAVKIPPSKSYTARALLLAAMSDGVTKVSNPLDSDDSRYMLEALKKIGYTISGSFQNGLSIGERVSMSSNEVELHIGNAGTAMRFLTGFLAFTPGRFLLKGDARMHQRPIGDLVDALRSIDCEVEYAGEEGYPPLRIRGKKVRGAFEVSVEGSTSSQFVSSLMMAGATLQGGIRVRSKSLVSKPYVEITKEILERFGASVSESGGVTSIVAPRLQLDEYVVEGDWSSASYWIAASAILPGELRIAGLSKESKQGDRNFLDVVRAIGCEVRWDGDELIVRAPEKLRGGRFDFNEIPDVVPAFAAIAPLATERVEIVNIANLRVKESDRIAVIASELRKFGAKVEEGDDFLAIEPGWSDQEATIESHDDHRIAMAFAIAGLARGGVTISGEQSVSKSYPRFWRTLDELVAAKGA